ncbi:DUF5988 family protein [Streptomyces sp. NPDC055210]
MRRTREEVDVVLVGGPDGVPERIAVPAESLSDRLTVRHLNGREHFEATDKHVEIEGCSAPVYEWIYNTKIAE